MAAIDGAGNDLANIITGNSAANLLSGGGGDDNLSGGEGDDTLDGGAGSDFMFGGLGNDTYCVDAPSDGVTENSASGTDVVRSTISYGLGSHVENLVLLGSADLNGTGNDLANVLTGNSRINILNGGIGAYFLLGEAGNDQLIGSNGTDFLDGGLGADAMDGGPGSDTYIVDDPGDGVLEANVTGVDLVNSSVTFVLGAYVENLTLTGSAAVNGTGNVLANVINGNAAANVLRGGQGDDTLNGGAGNDLIDGGAGIDVLDGGAGSDGMDGGPGDDTYIVDDLGDRAFEASALWGVDRVRSSVDFRLGANVENLTLTGSAAIKGIGNDLANSIVGNDSANWLKGGGGDDTLNGGGGSDTASYEDATSGVNIDLNFAVQSGSGGLGTDTLYNIESVQGSNYADVIVGNALDNELTGGSGNDNLEGQAGKDRLYGDDGMTRFRAAISMTYCPAAMAMTRSMAAPPMIRCSETRGNDDLFGGDLYDTLYGGAGDDELFGEAGGGVLYGLDGNDILSGGSNFSQPIAGLEKRTIRRRRQRHFDSQWRYSRIPFRHCAQCRDECRPYNRFQQRSAP